MRESARYEDGSVTIASRTSPRCEPRCPLVMGNGVTAGLVRAETPEERELTRKLFELGQLEEILADRELLWASLSAEICAFELRYGREVGALLAELDRVEAEIAEEMARLQPRDAQAAERARISRKRFEDSSRSAAAAAASTAPSEPDANLRGLYREVARQLHPDLAADDDSRAIRTRLMAEANRAYAAGDDDTLRALLRDWAGRPESIVEDSVAARLVRTIRKIDQVRGRLKRLVAEIAALQKTDAHELMQRAKEADEHGRDLLAELATKVRRDIAAAKARQREMAKS